MYGLVGLYRWLLFAALDLGENRLYRHIKPGKTRTRFLEFFRHLRSSPPSVRISIICATSVPHLTTANDARVGTGPPRKRRYRLHANASRLNRVEVGSTPGGTSRSMAPTTQATRNMPA